jgi:hypothetical protein
MSLTDALPAVLGVVCCSGRVDLKSVEVTIQNLIGSGMDPKTENNPYLGFIYTSFQVGSCVDRTCWLADPYSSVCSLRGGYCACLLAIGYAHAFRGVWLAGCSLISASCPMSQYYSIFSVAAACRPLFVLDLQTRLPGLPCSPLPQERATKVSHGNTARMAAEYGDETLGKLCGAIASDESRHEIAYTRIVDEFFRWAACDAGAAGCP